MKIGKKVKTKIQRDISKWNNLKVMLSKIWYLAYVETLPKPITTDIKKAICNFLWNFKKIRVNTCKHMMTAVIDIETQCKAIKCAVIAKFLRDLTKQSLDRNVVAPE